MALSSCFWITHAALGDSSVDVVKHKRKRPQMKPLLRLIQPGFASGVAALCRDKALRRGERGILPLVAAAGILLVLSPSLWAATGNSSTGTGALAHDTTGADNTADGFDTLNLTTSGASNTATGDNALYDNTTGHHNAALGYAALAFNTTGNDNTAIGHDALEYSAWYPSATFWFANPPEPTVSLKSA